MTAPTFSFSQFLDLFLELDLPVFLNEESGRLFSIENPPVPEAAIRQYLLPLEGQGADELTEFAPCFKLKNTRDFHAVVYWKAALMNYQFSLVTFAKSGELIDRKVIAGIYSDGITVTQSVATIEEDWEILIVSGQKTGSGLYDPKQSTTYSLEIQPSGVIIPI